MTVLGHSSRRMWVVPVAELESPAAAGVGSVVALPQLGKSSHPWDEAHRLVRAVSELEGVGRPSYAEPDLMQTFPYERLPSSELESFNAPPCSDEPPDRNWSIGAPVFGWHLDDEHSQLKTARDQVGDPTGRRIRVGILDTGYDPDHSTLPRHFLADKGRNFVEGDPPDDATDPGRHFPTNQPGHGTATMALLAGNRVAIPRAAFDDFLGGAPFAEVVPIRIADSVIHFRGSAMAAGIDYAVAEGCDVVSISMGGVPTRQWAAAVNRAYDAGMVIVAAAGNHFGPLPPASIVYPGRFNRVVAVCGVTADGSPYYRQGVHILMHGCFGPAKKMETAIAGFTPNAPWAVMGCRAAVGFGGGTSSATPQVAAAAALWLQAATIPVDAQPWQRVEAVRFALFSSARKDVADRDKYFGQGLLRASAALGVPFRRDLPVTPPDEVSFPWIRLLGVLETVPVEPAGEELMYEVEALQLFLQTPTLEAIVQGADPQTDTISVAQRKKLIEAIRALPSVSAALRQRLNELCRRF